MCRLIEKATSKGIKVINEIGVAFAHSKVNEKEAHKDEINVIKEESQSEFESESEYESEQ